jgi:hypothetical protein
VKDNPRSDFRVLRSERHAPHNVPKPSFQARVVVFRGIPLPILAEIKEITHFFAISSPTAVFTDRNDAEKSAVPKFLMHPVRVISLVHAVGPRMNGCVPEQIGDIFGVSSPFRAQAKGENPPLAHIHAQLKRFFGYDAINSPEIVLACIRSAKACAVN